ncbi:MAG: hypothetical protein MJZ16_03980 [Bacteroidales bacterium]|nr:hypothetical protein [Bacteroidales bacterium]
MPSSSLLLEVQNLGVQDGFTHKMRMMMTYCIPLLFGHIKVTSIQYGNRSF